MKKLFATLLVIASALNILAQNTYVLGDYVPYEWSQSGREKVAAVYKNGELLYTAGNGNTTVYPKTILCDSYENVYWMVKSGNTEIWKNGQLFITTADTNKGIGNMFIKNDTLYYAGYETINGIPVAKIWKGENYTPHLTLGDGIHHSAIRNLSKDETSGNIYYCGYIRNDSINLPAVWNETGLLYSLPSTTDFEASEICIDSGNIYTLNIGQSYPVYGTVYKNETRLYSSLYEYDTRIYTLCAKDDNWYTYKFGHYGDHAIIMNGNAVALDFGYASSIDHNMPITKMKRIGDDIYATGFMERNEGHTGTIWKNFEVFQTMNSHCTVVGDICFYEPPFPVAQSEWYYEIMNNEGSITYQYLECAGDTTINCKRPKIIIRSNTQYDREIHTHVTHEYIYMEDGKVFWWNKELEEFTTLYDLAAEAGDEWEVKVGLESLTMHVDAVENYEYDGKTYRMLRVSDENGLFSGDIVCGIGHLTSFFPERLMNRGEGYRVTGLRCYWVEENLVFKINRDDCDAIYAELHNGIEEDGPSTGSGTFTVYPNPASGILTVSVRLPQCDSPTTGQTEYQISNLIGQTLLQGRISAETQQIDISTLPAGMYFISVGKQTEKFVVR